MVRGLFLISANFLSVRGKFDLFHEMADFLDLFFKISSFFLGLLL